MGVGGWELGVGGWGVGFGVWGRGLPADDVAVGVEEELLVVEGNA
jgi:hypothetical protein